MDCLVHTRIADKKVRIFLFHETLDTTLGAEGGAHGAKRIFYSPFAALNGLCYSDNDTAAKVASPLLKILKQGLD